VYLDRISRLTLFIPCCAQIVMRDRITSKPRGFGFISFADEPAAIRAMQDSHVIDGRTVGLHRPAPHQGHAATSHNACLCCRLMPSPVCHRETSSGPAAKRSLWEGWHQRPQKVRKQQ
jgi:hypothetical protein